MTEPNLRSFLFLFFRKEKEKPSQSKRIIAPLTPRLVDRLFAESGNLSANRGESFIKRSLLVKSCCCTGMLSLLWRLFLYSSFNRIKTYCLFAKINEVFPLFKSTDSAESIDLNRGYFFSVFYLIAPFSSLFFFWRKSKQKDFYHWIQPYNY